MPDDNLIPGAGTIFAAGSFVSAACLTTGINYWFFYKSPLADN
jgi:hypothetical protein